jgi:NADPH:quinone reductase-like Zn-dependent oxidoreductase
MKAIVAVKYGPPEVLQLKEVDKPAPEDNEVLIKIYAATVFTGDCEMRCSKFPWWIWLPLRLMMGLTKPKRPILGQELAGIIEAVGRDVTRFKAGDPVFANTGPRFGAYAEYVCLPEAGPIAIKPANMNFEQAAAVPTGGLNALHFLRRANIQPGQKVLIYGACGSIGTFGVQLAKYFGAHVTAVDRKEKLDTLRAIGADHVIDYKQEDFTRNGVTYDVIFDVVGKSPFSRSLKSLSQSGYYIFANPRALPMLRGLWANRRGAQKVMFALARERPEDLVYLKERIEAGEIKSVIDRIYPLEQIVEAHRYVDTGRKQGNVVITVVHND